MVFVLEKLQSSCLCNLECDLLLSKHEVAL